MMNFRALTEALHSLTVSAEDHNVAKRPPPSFVRFLDLPAELQDMIWDIALFIPSVVSVASQTPNIYKVQVRKRLVLNCFSVRDYFSPPPLSHNPPQEKSTNRPTLDSHSVGSAVVLVCEHWQYKVISSPTVIFMGMSPLTPFGSISLCFIGSFHNCRALAHPGDVLSHDAIHPATL